MPGLGHALVGPEDMPRNAPLRSLIATPERDDGEALLVGLVNVSRDDRLAEQVTGAHGNGPHRRTAVKKPRWNSKIINT